MLRYNKSVFFNIRCEINGFHARALFRETRSRKAREFFYMRDFHITSGQASDFQREIYTCNFCRECEARIGASFCSHIVYIINCQRNISHIIILRNNYY